MQRCHLLKKPKLSLTVRRTAAIGDSLAASVVAEKLADQGILVTYQTHPNNFCVLRRHRSIAQLEHPVGKCDIDLDGCYENDGGRREKHFHKMFLDAANRQLSRTGIHLGAAINCKPKIVVWEHERQGIRLKLEQYPRPWIFVCPRSDAWAARQVPNWIWASTSEQLPGTKFWLGTIAAPPHFVDLGVRHLDWVIYYLSVADLMITVDTGPLHIAAALNVPVLALGQSSSPDLHLNDQCDFQTIWPRGLTCLNCQKNVCPIKEYQPPCQNFDPADVIAAARARLDSLNGGKVSAVIAVYRPDAHVLNRCLEHVLPQVDEVIVCRDGAGAFPEPHTQHPKIRYIVKNDSDLGYGRKANFGFRHAHGEFVLLLNDDVDLAPDAVAKMKEVMAPDVGIVGNLLRYPDGKLQHAGKLRDPSGGIGYGHIDHLRFDPTIKEPREMENVCGASMLVRRKAFFQADCYPEDIYLYTEDDHINLAIRQKGWRIIYTPHATGIHHEHLSTNKTPNIVKIMHESNAIFGHRWGWYFRKNKDNRGMGVFA
jgi:GT2 family glycosyltransferase